MTRRDLLRSVMVYILVVGGGNIIGYCELGLSYYLVGQQLYIIYVILALPRGAQWRPVSSVEISIGDPLEAAGR